MHRDARRSSLKDEGARREVAAIRARPAPGAGDSRDASVPRASRHTGATGAIGGASRRRAGVGSWRGGSAAGGISPAEVPGPGR
ncbi:hypothetical protein ACR6C2_23980 [Streptomyces sp. INA 01156]